MALINCKTPDCTAQINTALACLDVTSLFGIRLLLEKHFSALNLMPNKMPEQQELDYANKRLQEFKIENLDSAFEAFKQNKQNSLTNAVKLNIKTLYLTCSNQHSHNYEVDCQQ